MGREKNENGNVIEQRVERACVLIKPAGTGNGEKTHNTKCHFEKICRSSKGDMRLFCSYALSLF